MNLHNYHPNPMYLIVGSFGSLGLLKAQVTAKHKTLDPPYIGFGLSAGKEDGSLPAPSCRARRSSSSVTLNYGLGWRELGFRASVTLEL